MQVERDFRGKSKLCKERSTFLCCLIERLIRDRRLGETEMGVVAKLGSIPITPMWRKAVSQTNLSFTFYYVVSQFFCSLSML